MFRCRVCSAALFTAYLFGCFIKLNWINYFSTLLPFNMSDLKNKTSSRTIQVVIFYTLFTLFFTANADNDLLIRLDSFRSTYKQLPRFWINSGFSPPAPLPINNTVVVQELLNKDVRMNIEYLAALPNVGISHVRIHWLLSLVRFTG